MHLLLVNDGQDLSEMKFLHMLDSLELQPLFCVGIHANKDRKNEYGTMDILDYEGRGAKAGMHQRFVLEELIPFLYTTYSIPQFRSASFAGFSLGGLRALDSVWAAPFIFRIAGVFSGSLWWRTRDLEDGYDEETDRIMHQKIRARVHYPGQRFYFTTGSLDETADRNGNGIIDSIDDTVSLISLLQEKGYTEKDIVYINYEDGKHDIPTWARAMPGFLEWGFGTSSF
jgi:predicted alpha/beta superfamily hydrolase